MSEMAFSSTNALTTDNCVVGDGFGFGEDLVTGHFEIGNCSCRYLNDLVTDLNGLATNGKWAASVNLSDYLSQKCFVWRVLCECYIPFKDTFFYFYFGVLGREMVGYPRHRVQLIES